MPQLKILIVGAGVAGCASAFWLAKLGHDVTVIERHHCLRVNGLQIDLRGYGIKVIRIMGLEEDIRPKLVPEEGFELVDSAGRRKGWLGVNKTGKGAQSMTSEYEIMRGDLCSLLHDKSGQYGAKYIFDLSVDSFEEKGDGVDVKFTDGKTGHFNLLIGADGQHSRIRRLLFAGTTDRDKDPGLRSFATQERCAYFTSYLPVKEGEPWIASGYLIPGNRFMFTRRHRPDRIQWYLKCSPTTERMKNAKRGDVQAEKEAFAEVFEGCGWRSDEAVRELREAAEDFYCAYSGFVKLDKLSSGHVILLGDSGWCPSSNGYGTTSAIVGAYILSGELSTHCGRGDKTGGRSAKSDQSNGVDSKTSITTTTTTTTTSSSSDDAALLTSLSTFETKMRPFIHEIQKGLSSEPSFFDYLPWTGLTIWVFNFIASVAMFIQLDAYLRYVLPSDDIWNWELPEYKDMVTG